MYQGILWLDTGLRLWRKPLLWSLSSQALLLPRSTCPSVLRVESCQSERQSCPSERQSSLLDLSCSKENSEPGWDTVVALVLNWGQPGRSRKAVLSPSMSDLKPWRLGTAWGTFIFR